jgi:hypothetical protein
VNGPWHYRQAERLLEAATEHPPGTEVVRNLNAEAQVHATLALAAATALGLSARDGMRAGDADAWEEACSVVAGRGPVTPAEPQ